MFACCGSTYRKYITIDSVGKNINVDALKSIYGQSFEMVGIADNGQYKFKLLEQHDESRPTKENLELIMDGKEPVPYEREYKLCTCPCHVVGSMIEH